MDIDTAHTDYHAVRGTVVFSLDMYVVTKRLYKANFVAQNRLLYDKIPKETMCASKI